MTRHIKTFAAVGLVAALGGLTACGDDGGSPTAPSATTTSVTIAIPAGGTIFIGREVQFEARETLSNGTARVATNATWGSDAPGVASVSATGLVRGVSPGEASIFADTPARGALRIRVYPNFGGTWRGNEVILGCEATGAFVGLCAEFAPGEVGVHDSSFTQTEASVNAVFDAGDGSAARMSGTISIGGELQLPSTSYLPPEPSLDIQMQNWRSRSDVPAAMTGSYDLFLTATGMSGFVRLGLRLENVTRTGSPSAQALPPTGLTIAERVRRRMASSR